MPLTTIQCDALREMGNIGAAHAATTLSQMLATDIQMNVPEISMVDIAQIHRYIGDDVAALVIFQIQGELSHGGYVLLHVPKESSIRLTNTMLGMDDPSREMTEMDRSALLEIGNIMVSAFLDATAGLLNIVMLPSPPALVIDMPHAALETLIAEQEIEMNEIVLFRTELASDQHKIHANILLLPNPPMLSDIITILEGLIQSAPQTA
ncbi:MAG: chemotaxis protein CheC [Methanobacteriota archaeon]|nr:MAG: chemotaxis protein CheC [Euryarchaeota archaeon]